MVEAPDGLRLDRLEERGIARDDAERRMAAQATDDDSPGVATYVLDNSGDVERSPAQVDESGSSSSGSEPRATPE